MKRTLARERALLIQRVVKSEVAKYLAAQLGDRWYFKRPRANCGTPFHPKSRWHFLCGDDCRREWGRGLFRPRRES